MPRPDVYWHLFKYAIRNSTRHVLSESNRVYLERLKEDAAARVKTYKKGRILWRAQLGGKEHFSSAIDFDGNSYDVDEYLVPHPPERMKPLRGRAKEGRVNPKGIACLYLSTSMNTATAEVRPWVGSYVSIGKFQLTKNVRLVDCTTGKKDDVKRPWPSINHAFSIPVTESDDVADYALTQILAEAFRSAEFDGVLYTSQFKGDRGRKGLNVALFDVRRADLIKCSLRTIKAINFKCSELRDEYSL